MIIHYKNGTTNFDGMDNIITPICISCTTERELNGIWIAELLIIKDSELRFKEIELNDYVKISTPSGQQLFRIKYIDDTATHAIRIECKHIFFDLEDRIIWDTFIQDRNGQQALEQILNNLDETTSFTAFSNISHRNNLRLVRTKGVTAILGGSSKENYLIERFKAELDIDNFNIKLLDRVGEDRGYQIREGKNLTNFEYSEDATSLCTRILPVLFDGITLPEKYVDSPLISKYQQIYSNMIKFDDIKLKERDADGNFDPEDLEGFETEDDMFIEARKRCLDLFEKERIDRVKVNATVNFIDLKKTEQYKDLEFIQRLDLGDTVEFIIESYKVTAKERIIRYVYNSLLEDYEEIEIGRESDSLFKGMDEIKNAIDDYLPSSSGLNSKFDDWYNKVIEDVTSQIHVGMKDSYVLVRANEILIMDTTDISTAQKVWRWNRGGLGFSSNGYNGTYTIAMTSNGQFVINEITCQKFIGNLIQAGTIQADRLSVEAKKNLRDGLITETDFNVGVDGILATVKDTYSSKKETTDKINTAIKNYKVEVDKEFDDVVTAYVDLKTEMTGAFRDGVISQSEAISINERLVALEKEKEDVYKEFNTIYSNSNLNNTSEKTELLTAKTNLDLAYLELKNAILNSIADNKILESEITEINTKTTAYNFASSKFKEAFSLAVDKIGSVKVNVVNSKTENLKESFTEFKQTSEDYQLKSEKRGTANLLSSANGKKGYHSGKWEVRRWDTNLMPIRDYISPYENSWAYPDKNINTFQLKIQDGWGMWGGDLGIIQHDIQVVKGETYTISAFVAGHRHNDCYLYVRNSASNSYDIIASVAFTPPSGGTDKNNWGFVYTTFVAQADKCHIEFGMRNGGDSDPYLWFAKPMLNKGSLPADFTESQNELHTGIMKVDHNGSRCDFENGTRAEMGRDGFYYRTGDGAWEYHALSLVGEARIASESTRYIYLPEVFRGKRIKVICQVGQIGNGTDAISNPKPLISFWAGADDLQNNPVGYAPYFRLYGSTRLRNNDGSIAYQDKEVLITYTVLA